MNQLRKGLPPLPSRMQALNIDHRGYPVPWFVAWIDGKPDFRVMDGAKIPVAVKQRRCWLCGETLGKFMTFCLGPMCAINRTISEPPSHLDCMEFSVKACPFLSMPKAKRRESNLPEESREAAGVGLKRNPGAVLLWTTRSYRIFRAGTDGGSNDGILFRVGDPVKVAWYAEGREATRAEVMASIDSGLPQLQAIAQQQGPEAVKALTAYVSRAMPLLPAAQHSHE